MRSILYRAWDGIIKCVCDAVFYQVSFMKKGILFLAFLVFSVGMLLAQQRTVKGVVVSRGDNQAVIGATVVVKGNKTLGAATDIDGRFSFKVPADAKTLVVSYVGYVTQEVAIKEGTIRVVLETESTKLDDLVVVAYGTARKSSFTGAAVALDKKKLEKSQVSDVSKALEGMVAGLQVSSSSGAPGAATDIRIRGIGSLNGSSAPLIILDGAPYTGDMNQINPADIESLNILKDAASAALYGARGANGVILITTKSGKEGKTAITFDARLGMNQRGVPEYDILTDPGVYYSKFWEALRNSKQYGEEKLTADKAAEFASGNLIKELGYNIYKGVKDNEVVGLDGKLVANPTLLYEDGAKFNDWASQLYAPQMRQEYNLSLSKGSTDNKLFFSVGYLNDKGFNLNTGFQRVTSRIAYDTKVTPWLKLTASSQFSHADILNEIREETNFSNTFQWTRRIAPIYPVFQHDANGKLEYYPDGKPRYDSGDPRKGINGTRAYSTLNLVEQQNRNKTQTVNTSLIENLRADLDFGAGFKFNTTATYTSIWNKYVEYKNPQVGDGRAYGGQAYHERNQTQSINWNQVLTWDKQFGEFSMQTMLGHESYWWVYDILYGARQGLFDPNSTHLNNGTKLSDLSSYDRRYSLEGFFGQLTADYRDKYYISASLRRDGSSVFAPENRWGTFWSVGASWRIKEEEFLKNVRAVDNLKLRLSYGVQGNDYLYLPNTSPKRRAYTPYEDLYELESDGNTMSMSGKYKGNRNITWEKNANLDLGLEFSFWNGLLSGEFDLFQRTTTDMLFHIPTPSTTGFPSKPDNVGSMRNSGFEFTLNSNVYRTDKVSVSLGVNGAIYRNEVLDLPKEFEKEGITEGSQIIKEGGSIYDFYAVKWAGVSEADGSDLYWIRKDEESPFEKKGSKDYKGNNLNKQLIGSAIPKLSGGFYTNATFYGFDFSAQFAYRIGGLVYDYGYASLMGYGDAGSNWHKDILNSWSETNKVTDVPRVDVGLQSNVTDRFYIDGSYLSIRNLSLGYTLANDWLKRIHLQSARVYVAADNVALFSKRKGLDPRFDITGAQRYAVTSPIRTVSLGLSLSL